MIPPESTLRITGTRADGSPFDPLFAQQMADARRKQLMIRGRRPDLLRSAHDIQLPPRAVVYDHVVPWTLRERGTQQRGQAFVSPNWQERGEAPLLQRTNPNVLIQALGHLLEGLRYLRGVLNI